MNAEIENFSPKVQLIISLPPHPFLREFLSHHQNECIFWCGVEDTNRYRHLEEMHILCFLFFFKERTVKSFLILQSFPDIVVSHSHLHHAKCQMSYAGGG